MTIGHPERDYTIQIECGGCGEVIRLSVYRTDLELWRKGTLIQDALPYLTAAERETLISGLCGPCFDHIIAALKTKN